MARYLIDRHHCKLTESDCYYGRVEVLKYLIETCHCDPKCVDNVPTRDTRSPICIAAMGGKTEVVKYLATFYTDPNISRERVIHKAVSYGHMETDSEVPSSKASLRPKL